MNTNNYLINKIKSDCMGCRACEQVCRQSAINMIADSNGFIYPEINESLCNKCNSCVRVCPITNLKESKAPDERIYYACLHKDDEVVMNSASGGAFTAIAQVFCDNNYKIYGAVYNDDLVVEHTSISDINNIQIFRKSKYVQSDTKNTFKEVECDLKAGKKVLYSGVPCQIAGLKSYLKKDYENLLTVDLLCHGAASPKTLKKYLTYIRKKYKSKVVKLDMRNKIKTNGNSYNITDCKTILHNDSRIDLELRNSYNKIYFKNIGYRKACFNCRYISKQSDLTIGDCWGLNHCMPELNWNKGNSVIAMNSAMGGKIVNKLNEVMNVYPIKYEDVIKENSNIYRSTYEKDENDQFFNDLDKLRWDRLSVKYKVMRSAKTKIIVKCKRVIKRVLIMLGLYKK